MKFIAVQTGARRGYAVPAILEQAGMLERFYTDVCGSVGLGASSAWLRRLPVLGRRFQKLHARQLPPAVADRTYSFGFPAITHACRSWLHESTPDAALRNQVLYSQAFGRAMIRRGMGQATHVYAMLSEGGLFLKEAKRCGLTVISEVYIAISTARIMLAEHREFPKWQTHVPDYARLEQRLEGEDPLLTHCDYYLCPSPAVRDDLTSVWGVHPARTAVVPYGMDPKWLLLQQQPVPGRVLFVGTADLRKGIHYLAMAAERLAQHGANYEFRVAGDIAEGIQSQPICKRLKFLGRIPRSQIHEEFQAADVFVLPSLAEGSAEVTYEALAAGVPVITTYAAGSIVRDGVEGRIVPTRDPQALAEAIRGVVEDRPLRNSYAAAARRLAGDYTWEQYGGRLIHAIRSFDQPRPSID